MKKILVLLLVAVLCVSLCACGASKEEMLKDAIEMDSVDVMKLFDEIHDNIARAKAEYDGKYVLCTDMLVSVISKNKFESWYATHDRVYVHVPQEELIKIDEGERVSFVGQMEIDSEYVITIKNATITDID